MSLPRQPRAWGRRSRYSDEHLVETYQDLQVIAQNAARDLPRESVCRSPGVWIPTSAVTGTSQSAEQTAKLSVSMKNQIVKGLSTGSFPRSRCSFLGRMLGERTSCPCGVVTRHTPGGGGGRSGAG